MNEIRSNFFDFDILRAPGGPAEQLQSLPNDVYCSDEFARLENERLFPRLWINAGEAHQIPGKGDILPVSVAGRPVLLLRDRMGEIRAYLNSCRHRGAELVEKPCSNAKVISCPYHAWTYELDGRLKAAPHFEEFGKNKIGPDGAMDELGLVPVRCEVWHDWIFVNLDGAAPPLADYMAPFSDRLADYDLGALVHAKHLVIDIHANWKLLIENFIEPYHIGTVHKAYNRIGPFQDYNIVADGNCFGVWIENGYPESWNAASPTFSGLPDSRHYATENISLFPNFFLVVTRDFVISSTACPRAVNRTDWHWNFYFIGDDPAHQAARDEVISYHDPIIAEDVPVLEAWQRGLAASHDSCGKLSPRFEPHVKQWQKTIIETMS